MKHILLYRPTVFRFRRWSRKGYAVFCSLGWVVTICRGCKSIADASLRKSGMLHMSACIGNDESADDDAGCRQGESSADLLPVPVSVEMTAMGMASMLFGVRETEACASCFAPLIWGYTHSDFSITRNTCSADDAREKQQASSALHVSVRRHHARAIFIHQYQPTIYTYGYYLKS